MPISYRDFVRDTLIYKLLNDVKDQRIFNEADMQYRAACHLDREVYRDGLFLTNQPRISIGRGRGVETAKPDIVVWDDIDGPIFALELKCCLKYDGATNSLVCNNVSRDLDKLRKFRLRYPNSRNTFAIVFLNVANSDDFACIRRELTLREEWQKHYLFTHVVNVFCDENGRKRPWYNRWQEEMNHWMVHFDGD